MTFDDSKGTRTYFIRTYGCQMNLHDSEHIVGMLRQAGFKPSEEIDQADLVIFNTCMVRKSAEEKIFGTISSLTSKNRKKKPMVAVCGCMAQIYGVEILNRFKGVDLVFGLGTVHELERILDMAKDRRICAVENLDKQRIDALPCVRERKYRAWLPISHGCNNFCSYCIVPFARGREKSRALREIIEEATLLAADGVIEVVLLGHNVNSYGADLENDVDFADVLQAVSEIPGIRRIRFETSHPKDLSEKTMKAIGNLPEVCEHLHLPVQSGSDAVLERMNRGYTRDYYLDIVTTARELIPDLSLTTDIIVGFPGETEEQFSETLDLVERVKFDSAYVFIYSPRPGTKAYEFGDDLLPRIKHRRFNEVCRLQQRITSRKLQAMVGRHVEVLIEGMARRGGLFEGRTRGNHVVLISDEKLMPGMMVDVVITGAGKHALRGKTEKVLYNPFVQ